MLASKTCCCGIANSVGFNPLASTPLQLAVVKVLLTQCLLVAIDFKKAIRHYLIA